MFTGAIVRNRNAQRGSILFATLALLFITAIGLGALVAMTQQEMRITDRAVTWKTALPVAEAGIEEAMAHLNSGSPRGSNGWTLNGGTGTFHKQRLFGGSFFQAEISATEPPVIRSRGFVPAQPHTNLIDRAVEVATISSAATGIIVKNTIKCGSGGIIDSYNSADPKFSSVNGLYDPSKAKDTCLVASITNTPGCVDVGSRRVFGFAATGSGGSVLVGSGGSVGSKQWVLRSDTGGKIEPGHYLSGYTHQFPEIVVPIKNPWPPMKDVGGYKYVLSGGDYEIGKFSIGPKEQALVIGHAKLLVTGDFTTQGAIVIKSGASLELYIAQGGKITGQGFINENGRARTLRIYALGKGKPGEVSLQGSADFIGQIYAPHTEVKITGSCRYYGSVKAYAVDLSGATEFHADEDLAEGKYMIASWREIP